MLAGRISWCAALAAATGLELCGGALATGTATLGIQSPQDALELAPGATVEWTLTASISPDSGAGLALIAVDLVQAEANPERFDLPPAAGVPPGLEAFSRPLGISNPGEGGLATGYVGVQRGAPGAMDLVQIGGAQNTSGRPGGTVGTSTAVVAGIGLDLSVVIASGSFAAPAAPGVYTFLLRDGRANTVDEVRAAPAVSPASAASVVLEPGSFSFSVVGPPACAGGCFLRGDCNGDGQVTGSVTDAVFLLSYNFGGGREPPCLAACDANGDGAATGSVTDAVFLLQFNFLGGAAPPPPFPECGPAAFPGDLELDCAISLEGCV